MSAFLGPIHSWLYNKILIQQDITTTIVNSLDDEKRQEVTNNLEHNFEQLPDEKLEDIIDENNIHGWLQEKVNLVEERYAYAVGYILKKSWLSKSEIEEILFELGKTYSAQFDIKTTKDCFDLLNNIGLDGMPCDHINSIFSEEDNKLDYKISKNIHCMFWSKNDTEPSVYFDLRNAFINGILAYTPYRLKIIDDNSSCFYKNSVTIMMHEHQYILRMVKVVRKACYNVMNGAEIDYDDFADMISFVRGYADKHHHAKEEKIMFKQMTDHLGKIGDNLIRHGMLVEHDLGRLFMKELEESLERVRAGDNESKLDVIANAISYTHLIKRHIDKEDQLVYCYGERNLPEDIMIKVNQDTMDFETNSTDNGIQKKYMSVLSRLEEKYL